MNAEKQCPYCAETIRAEAIKCRYCQSDLTGQQEGDFSRPPTPIVAACPNCNVALVPTQVRKFASAGGILGALIFVIGIFCLPFGVLPGLILMGFALIVSSIGGKKTVMICPSCRGRGQTLAN